MCGLGKLGYKGARCAFGAPLYNWIFVHFCTPLGQVESIPERARHHSKENFSMLFLLNQSENAAQMCSLKEQQEGFKNR
jgi:hypothetical protein